MSSKPAAAAAATADAPAEKKSGKGKLLKLGIPLVLAAVLAGLWFTGILPGLLGLNKAEEHHAEAGAPAKHEPPPPVFADLPDIIANLNGNPHRPTFLKLTARLELSKPEDNERVKAAMPRLLDMFQTYVREMRPEELRGSAGTYRLREELISRANIAASPAKVTDVLFLQLLVQ